MENFAQEFDDLLSERFDHELPTANLFPEARLKKSSSDPFETDELREYCESVLVGLARQNKLHLTDIFQEPVGLRDLAASILLGEKYDHQAHTITSGHPIPSELANYRVKLRSVDKKSIIYKSGKKQDRPLRRGAFAARRLTDEFKQLPAECEVSPQIAWPILNQQGKYCRPCRRTDAQKRLWRVEECRPERVTEVYPQEQKTPSKRAKNA